MDENKRLLATTETSLEIIEKLKQLDGGRVTEVADEVGIAPSTAHSHLTTLEQRQFVIKEGDEYRLGLKFLELGEHVQKNDYFSLAESKANQLAEETGGRAHFTVEEHGQGVYVYTFSGKHAIETYSREGRRFPLHQAAAGKAILAYLPDEQVDKIVDRYGLERRTDNTITERKELKSELATIRDRNGVSFNHEEQVKGIRAVGAPICSPNKGVIGALSVSGPAHRFKGEFYEEQLPDIVIGTANELELQIQYS
ncbi:IclR family transcriptional regulator [Natrononativus amylolyticus]|uniref:IclR family transcriptional regulator n=1 Tax=Natrononativus amylolyticus TaxID=2963434 RepID=UPI0020CF8D99|nr:IclR family transcriptional regulator [Natrononativus amylolyticus]